MYCNVMVAFVRCEVGGVNDKKKREREKKEEVVKRNTKEKSIEREKIMF